MYSVSDTGAVVSHARTVEGRDGVMYPVKERIMKAHPHKDVEYHQVSLWVNNKGHQYYVHRLVAKAFIANPKNLPEVNHKDGNRTNNAVTNLEWVTGQENKQHAIRTGLKVYTNRLTLAEFTECLHAVIAGESYHALCQRVPYKVPFLSVKIRKVARALNLETELNTSLAQQRTERARVNGTKNRQTNHSNIRDY